VALPSKFRYNTIHSNKTANIYVEKTTTVNTLVTMTMKSDVENSKN